MQSNSWLLANFVTKSGEFYNLLTRHTSYSKVSFIIVTIRNSFLQFSVALFIIYLSTIFVKK